MGKIIIKLISVVVIVAFSVNTCCYGLATLPASQNPFIKREILATLQRTQIRYAESEDARRLLEANNASCLLLSSGKYLVTKEVAENDLQLLRAIIHEDVEAIMQIIAKDDRYKYQAIKELILKHFPPNRDNNLPIDLYVNHTIARAFEWLVLIEDGVIHKNEIPEQEARFINAIRPIIMTNKHNYFTKELWDSRVRGEKIRLALNEGMRFYQIASLNKKDNLPEDADNIIEEFEFYFQWANYDEAKTWADKLSVSHPELSKKLLSQIEADLDILKHSDAINLLLKRAYKEIKIYHNYETADHFIAMIVRHLDYINVDTLIKLIRITNLYESWFDNDFKMAYSLLVDEHKQPTLFPMGSRSTLGDWGISFPDQVELQQKQANQQKRPEPRKLRTKTTIGSENFRKELREKYWTEWPIDELPDSEIFLYLRRLIEGEKEEYTRDILRSSGELLLRIPKARTYFKVFLKAFPDNSSDHIVGFFLWNTDFRRIVTFEILKALKEYGVTHFNSVCLHDKRVDDVVIDDLIVQLYLSQNKKAVAVEINPWVLDPEDTHRLNVDIENLDDYQRNERKQGGIGGLSFMRAVTGDIRNLAGFVHSLDLSLRERGANIARKVSYDSEFTAVLLTDLIYTQLQGDRMYEIKYDAARLTPSQIEIIEEYVKLLKARTSNPDNVRLKPFSSAQGSRESLIAVYCTGKDFNGEGHIDVSIPEGELNDYLLRITGMLNIAIASASIPDNLSKEDVDKYRPIMSYIKNQYKSIIGEELAIPDSPEDILKIIRRIVLSLPKALRMNLDQIEEYNRRAREALTSA